VPHLAVVQREMLTRDAFNRQVAALYQHLYDQVYLRTHPLTAVLTPGGTAGRDAGRKERAWQLYDLLLRVIDELDPGPLSPPFSREWRRHRLVVRRYVDGLVAGAIAHELGISRRQFYREHEAALAALADVLWEHYQAAAADAAEDAGDAATALSVDAQHPSSDAPDLALLRLEAARLAQAGRHVSLGELLDGIHSLLEDRLRQRALTLSIVVSPPLARLPVEKSLLRQMLLGMLGFLVEHAQAAALTLRGDSRGGELIMQATVDPSGALPAAAEAEARGRLAEFGAMATLSRGEVRLLGGDDAFTGFELRLPLEHQHTILVVDDNDDVLNLMQRYLTPQFFRVVVCQSGQQALELAPRLQPDLITVDLMMPEQDGWDVLQALLNRPDTRHIPIVVCSVLHEQDLALALGAAGFIEKPITEQGLLAALLPLLTT
jgi:CheY-like chemotaxis protein